MPESSNSSSWNPSSNSVLGRIEKVESWIAAIGSLDVSPIVNALTRDETVSEQRKQLDSTTKLDT